MTGYGREFLAMGSTTITIEIKSVNHRFLDIAAKIPRTLLFMEDDFKRILQTYFHRGRIELYIHIEGEGFGQRTLKANWALMDQYMEQLKEAKDRYHLSGELTPAIITAIPDLFTIQETSDEPEAFQDFFITCLHQACAKVLEMRKEEGEHLTQDVSARMNGIREMVASLTSRRAHVIDEYRERIKQRIDEHVAGNLPMDDARIYQEIAILAEKGDITEEITRLEGHVNHFQETLKTPDTIGRKLDFIIQEMHRETNTIGAKSSDAKIGQWIVSLKSDIERIKEQVQNIE